MMRTLLLSGLLFSSAAHANPSEEDEGPAPASQLNAQRLIHTGGSHSIAVIGHPVERYGFAIDRCDRIRAFADSHAGGATNPLVMIDLVNTSTSPCRYEGVVLKGFLEGDYSTNPPTTAESGISIASGERIEIHVRTDEQIPRHQIKLEIPPQRDLLILVGYVEP